MTLILGAALGYAGLCWIQPFGRCRRCDGWGHAVKTGRHGELKRGKPCRRCKATGLRLRVGRRIHNHAVRVHDDGTR
jgi:hypothetical protein